jgi:heme A synthase
MFVLAAALTTQTALGAMNMVLLAPIWLQMAHLVVAEMFWICLYSHLQICCFDQVDIQFSPRPSESVIT